MGLALKLLEKQCKQESNKCRSFHDDADDGLEISTRKWRKTSEVVLLPSQNASV